MVYEILNHAWIKYYKISESFVSFNSHWSLCEECTELVNHIKQATWSHQGSPEPGLLLSYHYTMNVKEKLCPWKWKDWHPKVNFQDKFSSEYCLLLEERKSLVPGFALKKCLVTSKVGNSLVIFSGFLGFPLVILTLSRAPFQILS